METRRSLEAQGVYLNHFWTGVITNRSPLFTPMSSFGVQMIQRMDALIGGLNMEISPKATLWRRYPFTKFCTSQFSSTEWPLTFHSFKNIAGTIYPIVDTPSHVYSFTTTAQTSFYTKTTTAQSSFVDIGNFLYWCDGAVAEKWDGTHQWLWGITAPAVTPGLSYGAGALSPTSGYQYVYAYVNTVTGHISSASPNSANTGPQTSKNITVNYSASTDPQVNAIWIFRTADGGGLYYFLASVANANGSYTDSTPDSGLNTNLIAAIANVNAPPPAGISRTAFYAGRPWASSGNILYFGAGPDATIGVGQECWPAANFFSVQGTITCLRPLSIGLAVFTEDDLYIVVGNDITSFTLLPWQVNFGVFNENCVAQDGDLLFVLTSRGLLYSIQYGQGISEIGFNIRDKIGAMAPKGCYITLHRSGQDEGLFVSNGIGSMWRYGMDFGAWSPVSNPLMGCGAIGSIETSAAIWTLLLGTSTGSHYIYGRNTNPGQFLDDGTAYACSAIVGNIILAPPGQIAIPDTVLLQITNNSAAGSASIILQDASSGKWALTMLDSGILQTNSSAGTPTTLFITDSTAPSTSWQIGVNTSGILTMTSVTYNASYPTVIQMPTTPSGYQGNLYANNGILQETPNPFPVTFTYPTLSVLPNNVSGTFTQLPQTGDDPPLLSNTAYASKNPLNKQHQWKGVQSLLPQQVQSLQIQVAFTTDTTQSEILGVAVV